MFEYFLAEIGSKCRDKNANCLIWHGRGDCNINSNIRELCPKSCNLCDGITTSTPTSTSCRDNNPSYCEKWAGMGMGYCQGNYMTINCKKSCNLCGETTTTSTTTAGSCTDKKFSCKKWAGKGYCSKYKKYMTKNCKKSCDLC